MEIIKKFRSEVSIISNDNFLDNSGLEKKMKSVIPALMVRIVMIQYLRVVLFLVIYIPL